VVHIGHGLLAVGLLIICGPIDYDEVIEWLAEDQRCAKTSWTGLLAGRSVAIFEICL
jgi:hypothetical protein